MFTAIVTDKDESGYRSELRELSEQDLPEGDVTVRVAYSTLNYKDGLAITGKGPVVRRFPMVPGIDLAGVVESSDHPSYSPGDRVVLNGWGVGETHWGGLAQLARLQGDWLVPLPDGLSEHQAMAIGTAGYTAMLCLMALERHGLTPGDGDVLVTGANGGVGSFAISLLSRHGYSAIAATGRPEEGDYLRQLGRPASLTAPSSPSRGVRSPRSGGSQPSTPSAATPSPTSAPARGPRAPWRPAGWRRAWTCRPPWHRSSCAA